MRISTKAHLLPSLQPRTTTPKGHGGGSHYTIGQSKVRIMYAAREHRILGGQSANAQTETQGSTRLLEVLSSSDPQIHRREDVE